MFIYSIRASTIKFIAVVLISIIGLGILLGAASEDAVYASANGSEISYGGVKSEEDRIKFIEQFGLSVKGEAASEKTVALPDVFDRILNEYNELQKLQGLDLTKYKGKRVTHYSYEVTNYAHAGAVYINLYISRGRIVACDLSGGGEDAFVIPLSKIDPDRIK